MVVDKKSNSPTVQKVVFENKTTACMKQDNSFEHKLH